MKRFIRKLVPRFVMRVYHLALAELASVVYQNPSRNMMVIGVTGTKGKSTTSFMIAKLLESAGHTVGLTSTALFKVGKREWLNATKMTMLGRFRLQKLLRDMVRAGCSVAVVETSSEGVLQSRHRGIHYDMAVFTNLTPEHLEAHGGFENYKKAKRDFFRSVAESPIKNVAGKLIEKVFVVNLDDPHAKDFVVVANGKRYGWTFHGNADARLDHVFQITQVENKSTGSDFTCDGNRLHVSMPGNVNVSNATAAAIVVHQMGAGWEIIRHGLENLPQMPGRMERIENPFGFTVIVDYAHEPESTKKLYDAVQLFNPERIIHVTGSAGGGRDKDRRRVLGQLAGENADIVIVTNEDPYDEDPRAIMEAVANGARNAGKKENHDLYLIDDRCKAIQRAVLMAQKNDLVLITGKGSEQAIVGNNGVKVPHDDRMVVKSAFAVREKSR